MEWSEGSFKNKTSSLKEKGIGQRRKNDMFRNILFATGCLISLFLFYAIPGFGQEDKVIKMAIEMAKVQMRIPKGMEVKFIEKKESPISGFDAIKLSVLAPDKEIPIIIYVDSKGEKVIIGNLFLKGENVTKRDAGEPIPRKIDMSQLGIQSSPFRGGEKANVTIVEFSNFQCPYCVKSWKQIKELIEKRPQDFKYVFKHFPLQSLGKSFEISEIVAAVQELSPEAFWVIHDLLFSDEGQALVKEQKGKIIEKIEQILREKGYDSNAFKVALETGKGKKRVEGDMAIGNKVPVMGTPTTIINGDFIRGGVTDKVLDRYLGK